MAQKRELAAAGLDPGEDRLKRASLFFDRADVAAGTTDDVAPAPTLVLDKSERDVAAESQAPSPAAAKMTS
jgi:hypothetical protein